MQSDGTNSIGSYLYLGTKHGSSGTYSLSGGSLSASYEYVGSSGTGTFTQSGGTHSISNYLYLGYSAGSSGTYCLSGNGRCPCPPRMWGLRARGPSRSRAGPTASATISISATVPAGAARTASAARPVVGAGEYVGYSGTGSYTQSGGTNQVSGILGLGANTGSTGMYTLTGTGTLSVAGGMYVGDFGPGRLEWFSNTSTLSTPTLTIGPAALWPWGSISDMGALTSGTLFGGARSMG